MSGEIRFGENAHEQLYELEAGNFWFRARNRLLLWAVATYFGEGPGRYLEIGCGTGFVLAALEARFPALDLCGSEALEEGLALAHTRVRRARLERLDARALPYTEAFELVGAFDVLEHIAEDREVLGEVRRALAPGGLLFLTVPQHPSLWGPGDEYAGHARRYTRPEMRGKLEEAGFEVLRLSSFVSVLLPLMVASRWKQRLRPSAYDPNTEFAIPGVMNRAFEAALGVERALIQRGVDFPAGGSLLAVARKC
ncbi:MAG: hypothetical protein JWM80_738 [Cyanobacteria bacterium RYN_339]|nr:hypothetical protein [Cyanobacteria bacterium RYN_339]